MLRMLRPPSGIGKPVLVAHNGPARPAATGRQGDGASTMDRLQFYIDGAWVDPKTPSTLGGINPATEETFARISLGSAADVDRAVAAARRAFVTYAQTSVEERLAWLRRIIDGFKAWLFCLFGSFFLFC